MQPDCEHPLYYIDAETLLKTNLVRLTIGSVYSRRNATTGDGLNQPLLSPKWYYS